MLPRSSYAATPSILPGPRAVQLSLSLSVSLFLSLSVARQRRARTHFRRVWFAREHVLVDQRDCTNVEFVSATRHESEIAGFGVRFERVAVWVDTQHATNPREDRSTGIAAC